MGTEFHHVSVVSHDLEAGLRFSRDGIGMEVLADFAPEGDYSTLFDAPDCGPTRSVLVSNAGDRTAGPLELVELVDLGTR